MEKSTLVKKLSQIKEFKKIWKLFLLDLLFPNTCIACEKIGQLLCEECFKKIPIQKIQICPICKKSITLSGKICRRCKKISSSPLNRLIVCSSYKNKILARAIHLFKYRFLSDLSIPLAQIMIETLRKTSIPLPDFIIPVPLHPFRLRTRGFNQSEMLANEISKELTPGLEIPISSDTIFRTTNTPPQMKIKNRQKRQANLSGAFNLNPKFNSKNLQNKNILLIDDICTTGATLFSCATTLQKTKPRQITAIVLAGQN